MPSDTGIAIARIAEKVKEMAIEGEFDDLSIDALEDFMLMIVKPKYLCTEDACSYLEINRTEFYQLKRKGLIPEPRKIAGIKAKLYTQSQLNRVKKSGVTKRI